MNIHNHTHPDNLERYAFLWSEARLIIGMIALFLNANPPLIYFFGSFAPLILMWWVLKISYILSGVAALYLAYRWLAAGQKLFGHKDSKDMLAFLVLVVSGINLGLAGIIGQNIGMTIASSYALFLIVGVVYFIAAYRLYTRWNTTGQRLFRN